METLVREDEKEIRLTIEEFEAVLKKANVLSSKDYLAFCYGAYFEPGELVIRVVK